MFRDAIIGLLAAIAKPKRLRAYDLLPTLIEPVFDEYVDLAVQVFSLSISLIGVVKEAGVHHAVNCIIARQLCSFDYFRSTLLPLRRMSWPVRLPVRRMWAEGSRASTRRGMVQSSRATSWVM